MFINMATVGLSTKRYIHVTKPLEKVTPELEFGLDWNLLEPVLVTEIDLSAVELINAILKG